MNARIAPLLVTLLLSIHTNAAAPANQASQNADAAASKPRGGDCMFSRTIDDWTVVDDETLIVWAPDHKSPYLVKLFFPEFGLKSAFALGFLDKDNDGLICDVGRDALIARSIIPGRADHIPLRTVQRIDVAEAKQLIATATSKPEPNPAAVSVEQSDMKSDKAGAQKPKEDAQQESKSKPPGASG
jgi:hypothetical protein